MNAHNYRRTLGRLRLQADDRALTPYAGLALVGELARRTGLVEIMDGELAALRDVAAVKSRRRGVSPGGLVVSLAECQIAGADCFDDVEDVRADGAGAGLRAVAGTPSASSMRQLARRFRPAHICAIERAQARVANHVDRQLHRNPGEPVTLDLDGTETEVYGRGEARRGVGRSHTGALAYQSYVVTWAQRGRALCSDLQPGNRARITAQESFALLERAERLLPQGHGQITVRIDTGFYSLELMRLLRGAGMRFTISAPRSFTMWGAMREIPEHAWTDAEGMRGAQVAEQAFQPAGWQQEPLRLLVRRVPVTAEEIQAGSPAARRRTTIPAEQLQMVIDGTLSSTFAYSFIVSDIPAEEKDTVRAEHFHRDRAQIEERFKDAKLGQPLRHLPSGDLDANRLWLACTLLALNLTALICDLSPAAGASGQAAPGTPLRRHAKALRRILVCVPARITCTARQLTLHFHTGFRYLAVFQATYRNITALNTA